MNQNLFQNIKATSYCRYSGHENKPTKWFCLFLRCKNNADFCINCLTIDDENLHISHKAYCTEYSDLTSIIETEIEKMRERESDIQIFRSQFKKYKKESEKQIPQKSQLICEKIPKIMMKASEFNEYLVIKKKVDDITITK